MTPIEQLKAVTDERDVLSANLSAAMQEVSDLKAKLDATAATAEALDACRASLDAAEKHRDELAAKLTDAEKARDEYKAKAEKLEAIHALKPAAFEHISEGAKPVDPGTEAADAASPIEKLAKLQKENPAAAREFWKLHRAEIGKSMRK